MKNRAILYWAFFSCGIFGAPTAFSQDLRVAELNSTPLAINPAFTGMFNGSDRANLIYRNQWASTWSSYVTYGGSFDMPVYTDKKGNYLAAGVQSMKEQTSGDASLANFYSVGSVAYHQFFGTAHDRETHRVCELAAGIEGGYNQVSVNLVNPNAFPYFRPNNFVSGVSLNYYSLNAGISFSQSTSSRFNYTIGLAGYNLNLPNNGDDQLKYNSRGVYKSYNGEIGANWNVTSRLTLSPEVVYRKDNLTGKNFIGGNEFRYKISANSGGKSTTTFFAGAWYSNQDVAIISAGVELNGLRIGVGYDYNYADLNTSSNGNGGFTVAAKYIFPSRKASGSRRVIPCNRF